MRTSLTALLAALAALAAPSAPTQTSAPKSAAVDGTAHRIVEKDCNCGTAYRTARDWHLHRSSTAAERAETSRLNREYLAAARAAPLPPPPMPDRAQLAYQQQLKNYRALTDSYERRLRDYRRLHPADQATLPPSDDARRQDAARLYPRPGATGY